MNEESVEAFVTKADSSIIRVKVLENTFERELIKLGFTFDSDFDEYQIQTISDKEKSDFFDKLRNLGVAFSSGKEWCPSEVFEYLRENRMLNGTYKMVSWTKPGSYYVSVK